MELGFLGYIRNLSLLFNMFYSSSTLYDTVFITLSPKIKNKNENYGGTEQNVETKALSFLCNIKMVGVRIYSGSCPSSQQNRPNEWLFNMEPRLLTTY